ncbi:MAG: hypothetical protein ACFB8W_17030 [Elainellaceae cyanobacterium]
MSLGIGCVALRGDRPLPSSINAWIIGSGQQIVLIIIQDERLDVY